VDETHDLVVIGAGPAGEVGAELAAVFGRRVLIIERDRPGGVVTTTGGAPTKALREAALYLTGYRQDEVYGVRAAAPLEAVMPTLRARIEHVRDVLQDVVADQLAARRIDYRHGTARLGLDRTVHISSPDGAERQVAAGAILVATGSRPMHPAGIPFDDPDVTTPTRSTRSHARPPTLSSSAAARKASSSPPRSPRSASRRRWSASPTGCCPAWTANWPG
jgi:NAD(P) transhydrogenase